MHELRYPDSHRERLFFVTDARFAEHLRQRATCSARKNIPLAPFAHAQSPRSKGECNIKAI